MFDIPLTTKILYAYRLFPNLLKEKIMFANSKLQAIICTADIDKAEHFYTNILG